MVKTRNQSSTRNFYKPMILNLVNPTEEILHVFSDVFDIGAKWREGGTTTTLEPHQGMQITISEVQEGLALKCIPFTYKGSANILITLVNEDCEDTRSIDNDENKFR